MNKLNNTLSTKEHYNAPKCETHEIVPEGMICQSEPNRVTPYSGDDVNDYSNGGWF